MSAQLSLYCIVCLIGIRPNQEIENDLIETIGRLVLKEIREKIFALAKEKVARCLCLPDGGGIFGDAFSIDPHECLQTAMSFVSQWEPLNRRVDHKYASDTIAFLEFVIGEEVLFPEKLVRCASLEKGTLRQARIVESDPDNLNLLEDLGKAKKQAEVHVVSSTPSTETHLVTVECSDKESHNGTDQSELENRTTANAPAQDAAVTEKQATEPAQQDLQPTEGRVSTPCVKTTAEKATSTEDLFLCLFATGKGNQMEGGESPIYRTEFEANVDYIERINQETRDKVKQIEEWKKNIDRRVSVMEKTREPTVPFPGRNPAPYAIQNPIPANRQAAATPSRDESTPSSDTTLEPPVDGVSQRATPQGNDNDGPSEERIDEVEVLDNPPPQKKGKRTRRRSSRKKRDAKRKRGSTDKPPSQYSELFQKAAKRANVEFDENPYEILSDPQVGSPDAVFLRDEPRGARPKTTKQSKNRNPKQRESDGGDRSQAARPRSTVVNRGTESEPVKNNSKSVQQWSDEDPDPQPSTSRDNSRNRRRGGAEPRTQPSTSRDSSRSRQQGSGGGKRSEPSNATERSRGPGGETGKQREKEGPKGAPKPKQPPASKDDRATKKQDSSSTSYSDHGSSGSTSISEGESPRSSGEVSYSKVVTRNGWHQGTPNNNNNNNKPYRPRPSNKPIPKLRCADDVPFREVYVQELDYSMCTCKEDLEDIVFEHCRQNGMKVWDLSTIPINNTRLRAGCKVTVHEQDYERALTNEFWPRGTHVRPWVNKPKGQKHERDERAHSE